MKTVETPTPDKQVVIDNATLDENEFEFDDSFTANLTDEESGKINVSLVTPEETLANSELATMNPNTTDKDDMRRAFCRDVARVARSYEVRFSY